MLSKINKRNFFIGMVILCFVSFLIIYNFEDWFVNSYPTTDFVKNYYITNSVSNTSAENAVTAVYLNYRLFDTLFETMLLFVSVIAVFYFSRHKGEQE